MVIRQLVFDCFRQYGVIVNPKVNSEQLNLPFWDIKHPRHMSIARVKVIQEFSQCKHREFLGLYHYFIPHCADILQVTTTSYFTCKCSQNHKVFLRNEESLQAFSKIKQAIADVFLLSHPHTDAPTNIMADASCRHSNSSSATATDQW